LNDGTYYAAFESLLPAAVSIKDVLGLEEDDYREVSVSLILDVGAPLVGDSVLNSLLYTPDYSGDPYSLSPAKDEEGGDGTGW
jgi:hypothetical protein